MSVFYDQPASSRQVLEDNDNAVLQANSLTVIVSSFLLAFTLSLVVQLSSLNSLGKKQAFEL